MFGSGVFIMNALVFVRTGKRSRVILIMSITTSFYPPKKKNDEECIKAFGIFVYLIGDRKRSLRIV